MRRLALALPLAIALALAAWSSALFYLGKAREDAMPFGDDDAFLGDRQLAADLPGGEDRIAAGHLREAVGEMTAILEGDEPVDVARLDRLDGLLAAAERGGAGDGGVRRIARACRMTLWLWKEAIADGVTDRASWPRLWVRAGMPAKRSAFILHGFSASPRQLARQADFLASRGFNVFTMRFSCHGGDPALLESGRFRMWLRDGEIACRIARLIGDEVYGFGDSMGGVVALHASTRYPLAGVVAGAPSLYLRNRLAETPVLDLLAGLSRLPGLRPLLPGVFFEDEFRYHTVPQPYGAVLEQRKLSRFVRRELRSVSCRLFAAWNADDDTVDPVRSASFLRSVCGACPAAFPEYAGNDHTFWDVALWLRDGHPNLREQEERMTRFFEESLEFTRR